mmetsp:Transcript_12623/g.16888  ORF Transcript_12623/g.16888 Transcript_12623/m.16888 type:complete len:920 (+) Transcript_12623:281-3040(+)
MTLQYAHWQQHGEDDNSYNNNNKIERCRKKQSRNKNARTLPKTAVISFLFLSTSSLSFHPPMSDAFVVPKPLVATTTAPSTSSSSPTTEKLILANKIRHNGNGAVITTKLRMSATAEPPIKTRVGNNDDEDDNDKNSRQTQTRRVQRNFVDDLGHHGAFARDFPRTAAEAERSRVRLSKARRLLDEFAVDPSVVVEAEQRRRIDEVAARAAERSSYSSSTTAGADVIDSDVMPGASNGNLQGVKGNYSTRWVKGMNVAEPLVKYDPVSAEKLLFRQPTKWLIRNVQIALPLGLWAAGVISDLLTGREFDNRRNRAQQLQKTISSLGPAIIKGGQALASRPDLMPSEYLDELQKLQDDVPRFSNEVAFATVEEELKMKFEDVFELIETEPIAAASIGQVYKARLISNGETVALKIQRPKCEDVIALDLYVLRWWSGVANFITELLNRDINLQSIIDDFGELIYRELDYEAEAANAQRFSELYASVPDVFVPKIYSEMTTQKVLTMEWVDGTRLTDSNTLKAIGLDNEKLIDTLVQCSLRQILENGFFHADPHAGNLLACADGRLCYLDFGMMSYAAPEQRNGFLLAVVHIVNRDWGELVRVYQRLGFIPEGTDVTPIEVALEKALPDVLNADITELNFKNVVGKLGDIMYTYPFSLPPFYIAIIRCLGVLEGVAIQVDPKARIISEAYPYVANRVLTDPQDELQEALRRLAFTSDGRIRWDRLESLLEEARDSSGYDVTQALDQLTNYLISDDGEQLLNDFADQIVETADSLGAESAGYIMDAFRSLSENDETAAVKMSRIIGILSQRLGSDAKNDDFEQELREGLDGALPEPTPTMQKFLRIATLLGARGSNTDPSKFVPLVRKLGQEPRLQQTAGEIVAKLGERLLSRTLRSFFRLPPPVFDGRSGRQIFDGAVGETK